MRRLNQILLAAVSLVFPGSGMAQPSTTTDGYALPQLGHVFSFPRDYGSHDDFKIEWWYITGHLFEDDGHRFGFQATFFRLAGLPPSAAAQTNNAAFGNGTLYLTHMALLDVSTGKFLHQQRLNRRGWDAFAQADGLNLRNGNWSLRMTATNPVQMELHGTVNGDAGFQLNLQTSKPLVVFGTNSVSRKAVDPTAASYYLTFTRLETSGQVFLDSATNHVQGEAWMDHEISSSQLGSDQAGWDWAGMQLADKREIMFYRMRRADGSSDPFSTLSWVETNGVMTSLPASDFSLETVRTWTSPQTGATYPLHLRLHTRDPRNHQPVTFTFEPLAEDQELSGVGSPPYWEGACRLRNDAGAEVGSAYLELTGYANGSTKNLR